MRKIGFDRERKTSIKRSRKIDNNPHPMTIYADDPNQAECSVDLDEDIIVNDYTSFSSSLSGTNLDNFNEIMQNLNSQINIRNQELPALVRHFVNYINSADYYRTNINEVRKYYSSSALLTNDT
jgi:hypothetical protein